MEAQRIIEMDGKKTRILNMKVIITLRISANFTTIAKYFLWVWMEA